MKGGGLGFAIRARSGNLKEENGLIAGEGRDFGGDLGTILVKLSLGVPSQIEEAVCVFLQGELLDSGTSKRTGKTRAKRRLYLVEG